MPQRIYPEDYFNQQVEKRAVIETTMIPNWVPILLGIALVGAFAIALYALSLNKREGIIRKRREYTPLEIE